MTSAPDRPGFADPAAEAQLRFRAALDAMARPGAIREVGCSAPPPPLCPAAAAVLLTLVDHETPLWLDPTFAGARDWVAFHCGAAFAPPDAAAFLLSAELPDLQTLRQGSDEAPEESATVILQLPRLGAGARFRLSGPGLAGPAMFSAEGLPPGFAALWAANQAAFPRGVDLILCAGGHLAALPRTVAVEAL
ncbi:MAG: phosphonate C-P lyase system protein PhnH [Acetobacteraceae bacterium]|nr:phosphonate C-P lyase system protein PhnH [Acetobacteraceae bacterium]